jgi:tripartite-type tricarboxylate transporter receptor subunit TctC
MKRGLAMFLSLAVLFGICLGAAWAEDKYPSRSLTYLITFDPGGQSDREARRQQPFLTKLLGQQTIIDYKVGGGGALGWKELARSKPDGYTFAGFNLPHVILQPMQQQVGYKTEQIVPVVTFQRTLIGLAVLKDSPYKTLQDFVDAAKKNPDKMTVGGSAVFSGPHFAALRLNKFTGIQTTYVPFTGSAPQMTAFLGGHTDACVANSDDLVRFKDKLRVLAITSTERFKHFPDSPTFKELGYDMTDSIDRGVAVPPGTPKEIIAVLEKAFLEIARDPKVQADQEAEGFVPVVMGHEASVEHIRKLTAMYKDLAADLK